MPESLSVRLLRGQCSCGAAQYEVTDAFRYAAICHCSNCRRTTGAAAKPFAGIEREKLRLVAGGESLLIVSEADTHDAHCGRCGSLLYSVVRNGAFVHVAMGTLVDDPAIRPTHHIFVGSKAAWEVIADSLPQYVEHKPPSGR